MMAASKNAAKKSVKMDKSRLVLLLIVPFLLIITAYAQDVCCVDLTLPTACSATSTCDGTLHQKSCDQVSGCREVCNLCSIPGSTARVEVWDWEVAKCRSQLSATEWQGVAGEILEADCGGTYTTTGELVYPVVNGFVYTRSGNQDIPQGEATVSCTGDSYVTGSTGAFSLTCMQTGSTTISAVKNSLSGQTTTTLALNQVKNDVKVYLGGAAAPISIIVNVTNPSTKQPISGASVTITGKTAQTTGTNGLTTFTNVPKGFIDVTATKAGYIDGGLQGVSVPTNPNSAVEELFVFLSQGESVTISGKVLNASNNEPVQGAWVKIIHSGSSEIAAQITETGADGSYSLTVRKDGSYSIKAGKLNSPFAEHSEAYVSTGKVYSPNYNILLTTAEPTIQRVTEQFTAKTIVSGATFETPIEGAVLYLTNSNTGESITSPATNSNGEINLPLQIGTYDIIATHPDYYEGFASCSLNIDSQPECIIEMRKIPEITVSGTVKNRQNQPINDALLYVGDRTKLYAIDNQLFGSFSFKIKVSSVERRLYAEELQNYKTADYRIPAGQNQDFSVDFILDAKACNSEQESGTISLRDPAALQRNEVTLSWDSDCTANDYKVYRKEGSTGIYQLIIVLPKEDSSYKDVTPEAGKTYWYKINATYDFGLAEFTELSSNAVRVKIANEECFYGDKSYCGDDLLRHECTSGTDTILSPAEQCNFALSGGTVANPGTVCMETSRTTTECVKDLDCSKCNRPFGVFSYPASNTYYSYFGGKGFPAPVFDYKKNLPSFANTGYSCDDSEVPCYMDVSETVVDKYYECSQITSCYDYLSQSACDNNKCLKSESCSWADSGAEYNELSMGVCRPSAEKRSCDEYNVRSTRMNNIFASGQAAKTLCELYADNCHISESSDPLLANQCISEEEFSCADYGNKESCTGENDVPVNVNATWNFNIHKKTKGTNIKEESDDLYEIGICQFENVCIRNADNLTDATGGVDCEISGDRGCLADNDAPFTSISIKNAVNPTTSSVDFFAYDVNNNYQSSDLQTYFQIVSYTLSPAYPFNLISQPSKLRELLAGKPDGSYYLTFFSQDPANNLEPVQTRNIAIDRKSPQVDFQTFIEPNIRTNTVSVLTALTLPLYRTPAPGRTNLESNDRNVYCVKDEETGLFQKITNPNGLTHWEPLTDNLQASTVNGPLGDNSGSELYTEIGTGEEGIDVLYTFKCYDEAGNAACNPELCAWQFTLDANAVISNPMPNRAVGSRTNVPISINTLFPGECKYSYQDNVNYDAWTPFTKTGTDAQTITGGYNHSSVVASLEGSSDHVTLYVACKFTGLSGYVPGNNKDNIQITIDTNAPFTKITDGLTGQDLTNREEIWTSGSYLELTCHDVPQPYVPPESGCAQIYFCEGEGCTPSPQSGFNAYPELIGSTKINFSSEDVVGNREQAKIKYIRFDDVDPTLIFATPFNQGEFETKELFVYLDGTNISNRGPVSTEYPLGCLSSPTCDISPLLAHELGGGLRYNLSVEGTYVSEGSRKIPDNYLSNPLIEMPSGFSIGLVENKVNRIELNVKDEAGNEALIIVRAIQDSAGPNLANAEIWQQKTQIIRTEKPIVDAGDPLVIEIKNVKDNRPGSGDQPNRVSKVWIEDMFGATYEMTKTSAGSESWKTEIDVRKWPVTSSAFPTYLIIHANDTLGNEYKDENGKLGRRFNFTIEDIIAPEADVRVENKYGVQIYGIVEGENFIMIEATEPLYNITMMMEARGQQGQGTFPVTFTARDYEATTWIGTFTVPEGYDGSLSPIGTMYDLNGVRSDTDKFFSPSLTVNSKKKENPSPKYTAPENGVHHITTKTPEWNLSFEREYQIIVNGRVYSAKNRNTDILTDGQIPVLNSGLNSVVVRSEDMHGNYKITQESISVEDLTALPNTLTTTQETGREPRYVGIEVINETKTTRSQNLDALLGTARPDTASVYLIGHDGKKYLPSSFDTAAKDYSFLNLLLVGNSYTETPNNLQIVFEDAAGNRATQTVSIMKDIRPPHLVSLKFTRIS